jgi:hypothetical protein
MAKEARLSWAASGPEALWDAWAFAAVEAELALDAWMKAAHHLKDATYAAYRQALDREEEAAADLAARVSPNVGRRLQTRWSVNRTAA